MTRREHQLTSDTVIEQTMKAGVFRKRRLDLRYDSGEASARSVDARNRVRKAMRLLGDSMGPVVWDVLGSGLSLRKHVERQANAKRVTVHEARGRLIAALDILARVWA